MTVSSYNKLVLTEKGTLLLNKVVAGECNLVITKASTGAYQHDATEDLKHMTELGDQRQAFGISSFSRSGEKIFLKFIISNFDAETGTGLKDEYRVREIGLFANDPDNGEILYAVSTEEKDKGDFLPAYDGGSPVTVTINLYILVGSGGNVSVNVLPGAYASAKDLQDFINEIGSKMDAGIKNPNELLINGKSYDGSSAVNIGIMDVSYGGTGQRTAQNASNSFLNALKTASQTPDDSTCYISQAVGADTYHRRPMSALWDYIKSKISSVLGLTSTSYGGNSATATALETSAGSATNPVYFSNGKPVAGTYTLGSACQRSVVSSVTSASTSLITSGGVHTNCQPAIKYTDVSFTPVLGTPNGSDVTSGGWVSLTGAGYNKHVFLAQIIKAWPVTTWTDAHVTIVNTDFTATYPMVQLRAGTIQQYQIIVRFYYTDYKWNNTVDK